MFLVEGCLEYEGYCLISGRTEFAPQQAVDIGIVQGDSQNCSPFSRPRAYAPRHDSDRNKRQAVVDLLHPIVIGDSMPGDTPSLT